MYKRVSNSYGNKARRNDINLDLNGTGVNNRDSVLLLAEERRIISNGSMVAFGSDYAMRNLVASYGYFNMFVKVIGFLSTLFKRISTINTDIHSGVMIEMNKVFPHHFKVTGNDISADGTQSKVVFKLRAVSRRFVKGTILPTSKMVFVVNGKGGYASMSVESTTEYIEVVDMKKSTNVDALLVAKELDERLQEITEEEDHVIALVKRMSDEYLVAHDDEGVAYRTRSAKPIDTVEEQDDPTVLVVEELSADIEAMLSDMGHNAPMVLVDKDVHLSMAQCHHQWNKLVSQLIPNSNGESSYYRDITKRQEHLTLKQEEQEQKLKVKVRNYLIPLIDSYMTNELRNDIQLVMDARGGAFTIKEYWELIISTSLGALKESDTAPETLEQIDNYLRAKVDKVKLAVKSANMNVVYNAIEHSMGDIGRLCESWTDFNLALASSDGTMPEALEPKAVMRSVRLMLSELARVDAHGADRLRQSVADPNKTAKEQWTVVKDYVVGFNRRNVSIMTPSNNASSAQQKSVSDRREPARVMLTTKGDFDRSLLKQILHNVREFHNIRISNTKYHHKEYRLIQDVVSAHVKYIGQPLPSLWCHCCGGDHYMRDCSELQK